MKMSATWEEDFRAVVAALVAGVPAAAWSDDSRRGRLIDAAKEIADDMEAARDERDDEADDLVPPLVQITVAAEPDTPDIVYGLDKNGRVWCRSFGSAKNGWRLAPNDVDPGAI